MKHNMLEVCCAFGQHNMVLASLRRRLSSLKKPRSGCMQCGAVGSRSGYPPSRFYHCSDPLVLSLEPQAPNWEIRPLGLYVRLAITMLVIVRQLAGKIRFRKHGTQWVTHNFQFAFRVGIEILGDSMWPWWKADYNWHGCSSIVRAHLESFHVRCAWKHSNRKRYTLKSLKHTV